MQLLSQAMNTYTPALLCLQKIGYELRAVDDDDGEDQTIWIAENAEVRLSAFDPLALLGLASLWQMRGKDWSKGHEEQSLYDLLMDGQVIQPK